MKKVKIGKGYYPSAYGWGFRKNPIVWLINGKAYVKDSVVKSYSTDLEGYTMVNAVFKNADGSTYFGAVGMISEHRKYE